MCFPAVLASTSTVFSKLIYNYLKIVIFALYIARQLLNKAAIISKNKNRCFEFISLSEVKMNI